MKWKAAWTFTSHLSSKATGSNKPPYSPPYYDWSESGPEPVDVVRIFFGREFIWRKEYLLLVFTWPSTGFLLLSSTSSSSWESKKGWTKFYYIQLSKMNTVCISSPPLSIDSRKHSLIVVFYFRSDQPGELETKPLLELDLTWRQHVQFKPHDSTMDNLHYWHQSVNSVPTG